MAFNWEKALSAALENKEGKDPMRKKIARARIILKRSIERVHVNEAILDLGRPFLPRTKSARVKRINSSQAKKYAIFMRELVANPRGVGAACPSSKGLARTMASYIPLEDDGYIVELGAGTGVVTAAILERGIDPSRLIVVEISEDLVKFLRKQFPNVRIVHGNAAVLKDHLDYTLGDNSRRVMTIVSSLPLRSLPEKLVDKIKQQLHDVLPHNGRLIHFTYALKPVSQNYPSSFTRINSKIRWRNLPPARVEVYHRSQIALKKE